MRNCLEINSLRSACSRSRRSGFSLAELVVSIGVLILMLALAGQIFSTTVRSSGQATALTQVSQLFRAFEQQLREDLRGVHPGRSLILIQGNPVNAYWSRSGMEADDNTQPGDGYPHLSDPTRERQPDPKRQIEPVMIKPRADILMFFTARKGTSFTNPGISSNLHQIVYGHAVLGEFVQEEAPPNTPPTFVFVPGPDAFPVDPDTLYPDPQAVSAIPAEEWHLARRDVLLVPTATPLPPTNPGVLVNRLEDGRLLEGEIDYIGNFNYEQRVLDPRFNPNSTTSPWQLPAIFIPTGVNDRNVAPSRSLLDVTPPVLKTGTLAAYLLPNCASFKVEWALDPRSAFVAGRLDDERNLIWFDPGDEADPNNPGDLDDPLRSLQQARNNAPDPSTRRMKLECLLGTKDDPKKKSDCPFDQHPDGMAYSLSDRFRGPELTGDPESWPTLAPDGRRPNLVIFGAHRLRFDPNSNQPPERVEEDVFPVALRITIDLIDRERRFERPMRRVIIVPVGG